MATTTVVDSYVNDFLKINAVKPNAPFCNTCEKRFRNV